MVSRVNKCCLRTDFVRGPLGRGAGPKEPPPARFPFPSGVTSCAAKSASDAREILWCRGWFCDPRGYTIRLEGSRPFWTPEGNMRKTPPGAATVQNWKELVNSSLAPVANGAQTQVYVDGWGILRTEKSLCDGLRSAVDTGVGLLHVLVTPEHGRCVRDPGAQRVFTEAGHSTVRRLSVAPFGEVDEGHKGH